MDAVICLAWSDWYGLADLTMARFSLGSEPLPPCKRITNLEDYCARQMSREELAKLRDECKAKNISLHDVLLDKVGWPAISSEGLLLVSHQDALLMGGKVQAPSGYADHVVFRYLELCHKRGGKICIEMCSGRAITLGESGVPNFDHEKCIHCGACFWNCAQPFPCDSEHSNGAFRAGHGGRYSTWN